MDLDGWKKNTIHLFWGCLKGFYPIISIVSRSPIVRSILGVSALVPQSIYPQNWMFQSSKSQRTKMGASCPGFFRLIHWMFCDCHGLPNNGVHTTYLSGSNILFIPCFPSNLVLKTHIFPHVKLTWKPHLSPRKTVVSPISPMSKGSFLPTNSDGVSRTWRLAQRHDAPIAETSATRSARTGGGYVLLQLFTQFFRCFSHQFHELYPVFFEFLLTCTFHEIPSFLSYTNYKLNWSIMV